MLNQLNRPECRLFIYIFLLVSIGVSMLIAARSDYVEGNRQDGRFLTGMGMAFLVIGGLVFAGFS